MTDEKIIRKLDKFFRHFAQYQYQRGEILIRASENPKGIFYLDKGYIRQYTISDKGDEITLNLYKPYSFFPMMWAINNTPNNYYFEAVNEAVVFVAPKDKVIEFIKNEPDILYDLTQRLYKGFAGILKRMEFLAAGDAYEKLIIILLLSRKRFTSSQNGSTINLKFTHKDLASYAGITRETVSREMKKLEDKGVISYKHNLITIKNLSRLETEFFGLNQL